MSPTGFNSHHEHNIRPIEMNEYVGNISGDSGVGLAFSTGVCLSLPHFEPGLRARLCLRRTSLSDASSDHVKKQKLIFMSKVHPQRAVRG